MNRTRWILLTVFVLLLVGIACAVGLMTQADPQVSELEQMRDKFLSQNEELADEERQQMRGEFRERMEGLTEDQRTAFFQNSRGMFLEFARRRMNDFFELDPEQQQTRLDEIVDRIIERRNQADGEAGEGPPGWGGRNMSEAERDERRKRRLDFTDPHLRAQFDEFRRMLNDRLEARGQAPFDGAPRRGIFGPSSRGQDRPA